MAQSLDDRPALLIRYPRFAIRMQGLVGARRSGNLRFPDAARHRRSRKLGLTGVDRDLLNARVGHPPVRSSLPDKLLAPCRTVWAASGHRGAGGTSGTEDS